MEYQKNLKSDELTVRMKRADSPRRPLVAGPELTLHVYQYFEEQVTDEDQFLRIIRRTCSVLNPRFCEKCASRDLM